MHALKLLTTALLVGIAAPAYAQQAPAAALPPAPPQAEAAPAPVPMNQPAVVVDETFTLGVGDAVAVGIVGRNDFNIGGRVSSEGTIVVPLLGKIKAIGLTTNEIAQQIQAGLTAGGFYANPVVRVDVIGVASRYVTVLGNVGNPGLMPLDRSYRLSDIIARVGAKTTEGKGTITLTRADGASQKYAIEDIATGVGADPVIQAGDKIYVPDTLTEVFYITGKVNSPGPYPIAKSMTVREAIAKGGGVTDMGSEKKVKLFRKNVAVKDVKQDTPLQAGDIVQIGERLF